MKKGKLLILAALLPLAGFSQDWGDDIYGSSPQKKETTKTQKVETPVSKTSNTRYGHLHKW